MESLLNLIIWLMMLTVVYGALVHWVCPLAVNDTATAFKNKYFRWKLVTVTGRVLDGSLTTVSYVGTYSNELSSTMPLPSSHDVISLQLADGSPYHVRLLNYAFAPNRGDVVTICTAHKGRKSVTVAALNHTGNYQSINDEDLVKVVVPRVTWMLICYALVGALCVFLLPLLIVYIPLFILFLKGQKSVRTRFCKKGIAPLWHVARMQAAYI
jgi:hypothetical protein